MNEKRKDRVKFISRDGDKGVVVRERDGQYALAAVTKVRDGRPIPEGAHMIDIKEPDADGWSECETLMGGDGPAQVATPAYREGYDRIFGKKPTVGLA